MSEDQGACQREVKDVFEKLLSWREESHKQFSSIIDSHSGNINKGITGLLEKVSDLRAELSFIKKEKDILHYYKLVKLILKNLINLDIKLLLIT